MSNFESLDQLVNEGLTFGRSCNACTKLQDNVEAAARELARAIRDAMVAIAPISGIAAGNRIEDAEYTLRTTSDALRKHQCACDAVASACKPPAQQ